MAGGSASTDAPSVGAMRADAKPFVCSRREGGPLWRGKRIRCRETDQAPRANKQVPSAFGLAACWQNDRRQPKEPSGARGGAVDDGNRKGSVLMPAPPVDEEPEVALVRWGILMHPSGDMHLAGLRADREAKGRISTALVRIDAAAGEAETRSGRRYRLLGEPDDDIAFEVAVIAWGYVNAVVTYPISAEEARLRLEEPPSPFMN